jgi:GntR family transcriptional regulator, transcriptional repressor for pyruvate dehydrogenase complex
MRKSASTLRATPSNNGATAAPADTVVDWMEQYIQEKRVAVGDSLPTEEEIVRLTKLSRTSVREALTRLRALGIIETKRKRGMRLIRSVALLDLIRLLSSTTLPAKLEPHVRGFRSALELGLGPEIFRRCKPADVKELREIFDEMVAHARDAAAWPKLEMKFHTKLVGISGNRLAYWFHQLLDPFFDVFAKPGPTKVINSTVLDRHRSIVDTLANREPFQFEHALREHHLRKLSIDVKGSSF